MQKKGISPIVLVITIIVMIILAGAVIISLSNSGIIGNANRAVKTSNEATVKELAQMAWLDAYADGVRTVEDEGVTKGFKIRVEEALTKNNIALDKYIINVTTSGVAVKSIDKAWIKEGFTVRKGDQVLEIGDIVNYDETAGETKTGLTQTDWKVLGADDNGNLLIMSTTNVSRVGLGENNNLTKCQQDWLNAPQILNTACEPYGYGKGTVGKARSITVEDVNKITGYDPTNIDGNGTPYGAGTIYEYGNKVTYKYSGADTIAYEGTNGVSDTLVSSEFHYYNGKEFKHITDLEAGTSGTAFAELTSNHYDYYAAELTTINSTENAKAYQMLFGTSDIYSLYWLASSCVHALTYSPYFAIYSVGDAFVNSYNLWESYGYAFNAELGVRAVVTLSSDIEFTGSSAEGWSY